MTTPIRVIEQPVEKLPQLPKLELLQNPTAVITFLRATLLHASISKKISPLAETTFKIRSLSDHTFSPT